METRATKPQAPFLDPTTRTPLKPRGAGGPLGYQGTCGNDNGLENDEVPMDNYTKDELQEALRPIASLISKSEKAQRKLAPGTWQHTMLRDNIKALQIASALMNKEIDDPDSFTRDDLQEAHRAFASMISKTEKSQAKFSPGTSQHTLQRNRLKALNIAEALIKVELDKG
jgi:hypothetical protein